MARVFSGQGKQCGLIRIMREVRGVEKCTTAPRSKMVTTPLNGNTRVNYSLYYPYVSIIYDDYDLVSTSMAPRPGAREMGMHLPPADADMKKYSFITVKFIIET